MGETLKHEVHQSSPLVAMVFRAPPSLVLHSLDGLSKLSPNLKQASTSVWSTLSTYGHIQWPTVPWTQVLQLASSTLKGNGNINSLIAKITLAVAVYYLWYERNNRTFKNIHRTAQELVPKSFI
ncbi:hypothetical protein OIU85_017852 [Salix viminalis]|uniref:Reverse transcriptase zinc-binding domain-containing protein n=1 Tax=Salix viminalis TaxID=40686 RepID=A0A9Q0UTK2_SALVM|nr:hypothetical protein OIU85_017852 [Salix viminalis]